MRATESTKEKECKQLVDQWIELHPDVQGGTPVVKGTRIPIKTVVKYLRAGYTPGQICAELPTLTKEAVEAVWHHHQGQHEGEGVFAKRLRQRDATAN